MNKDNKKLLLEFLCVFVLGQFYVGYLCGQTIYLFRLQYFKSYFAFFAPLIFSLSYLIFSLVYTWFKIIKLIDSNAAKYYKILFYIYILICIIWKEVVALGYYMSNSPLMSAGEYLAGV